MVVPKLFDDLTIELVDGGVHDNQGVEGLVDRGCTHRIISDGSGQMPDLARPSTRLPAVLGRVISIYGDAEREQRLLQLLREGDSTGFMHLQTGLPARERTPGGQVSEKEAKIESTDFGVLEDVQRALAQVRTDLDSFCEVEAWSLMADAYQLTERDRPDPRRARRARHSRRRRGVAVRGRRRAARPAEQEVPQGAAQLEAALPQARADAAAAAAGRRCCCCSPRSARRPTASGCC